MKTNRDEILQSALLLFMSMNYEKVSLQMVTRRVGITKTGIFNYYPNKLELFVAVADKYLFNAQDPQNKYAESDGTLADFIEKYVEGVKRTMDELVRMGNIDREAMPGKSVNAGYFHLFQQVLFYYPDGKKKLHDMMEAEYDLWRTVLQRAAADGEIRHDTDVEEAIALFRQVFIGLAFERSFYNGLETDILHKRFRYIYHLLKQ